MLRSRADLERAARIAGAELVETRPVRLADGSVELGGRFQFEDPWAAARLLTVLSDEDASDPAIGSWAWGIRKASPHTIAGFARGVHANVQHQIRFAEEEGERFQSARATMIQGVGDCDCHSRLVHALARSQGLGSVLAFFDDSGRVVVGRNVFLPQSGEPVHVATMLDAGQGPRWAETTVPAEFGEHPLTAARRLGLREARRDLGALGADVGQSFFRVVMPWTVDQKKAQLEAIVSSLAADVAKCATLDAGTRGGWKAFYAGFEAFRTQATSWLDTAAEMDQAEQYQAQISDWQTKLAPLCGSSSPTLPSVAPSTLDTLGKVVLVGAVSAAVVAGAKALEAWAPVKRARA